MPGTGLQRLRRRWVGFQADVMQKWPQRIACSLMRPIHSRGVQTGSDGRPAANHSKTIVHSQGCSADSRKAPVAALETSASRAQTYMLLVVGTDVAHPDPEKEGS